MMSNTLPNYSNPSMYNAYGQQNYQNYYPSNYPYQQQQYYPQPNQPCRQCPQMYYPNYANYPTNMGNCQNCAQYGLSSNRPRFPSKLPYSFVTSGDRVEDKLVINQPHQSAPFPTQHRKTYVPYTRKYIEYQDYIQYVPVQRSQWNYEKVMKQIDFVPQQYYESNIEYVPQQRMQHKIKYLPVEQQIVHMPLENIQSKQQISRLSAGQHYLPSQPVMSSRIIQVRDSNVFNQTATNAFVSPSEPYSRINAQQNRRVIVTKSPTINRVPSSVIRPAQSSVQMVPSSRLRPVESIADKLNTNQISQNAYQFPTSGGVIIGSASNSQQSQIQAHPDNLNLDPSVSGGNRIQASQVVTSVLNKLQNPGLDFRESEKVFSEQFNIDHHDYQKKETIFNRYQSDLSQ